MSATDLRRRISRIAIGFALASLVPGTAAWAVSEDVQVASPGFETTILAVDDISPKLSVTGRIDGTFLESDVIADEASIAGTDLGIGNASWYGARFAGRPTASGERFNPTEYTAAHRTLPFGSKVRVTSPRTGKTIVVRVNDRGPFHGNRVIDLSEAAAEAIGLKARGQDRVELALLQS
ncbi:septal ring lytic transglycosylase RlpA family protein [Croceicoccus ponticola]|uniref:Endolytic peptidoglycan transglycosylase RlpA n=1 Tax=Croceicoccus ponticola TaxID=2217664 RepID=A0A437GZU4_9SPHN|nr:septal ring lytic transglycosylase RlpA family protein [Croceicoccus ponticola]RVQ68897.1 septal ring lytic transglycosylase RlpA family protein [Croceicoccus ponticola]